MNTRIFKQMSSSDVYKSKDWIAEKAFIKNDDYKAMYEHSISKPDEFWFEQGQRLDWFTPYTKVRDYSYEKDDLYIKWYEDGELNASYNCLDRHVEKNADKIAVIWEEMIPLIREKLHIKNYSQKYVNFLMG